MVHIILKFLMLNKKEKRRGKTNKKNKQTINKIAINQPKSFAKISWLKLWIKKFLILKQTIRFVHFYLQLETLKHSHCQHFNQLKKNTRFHETPKASWLWHKTLFLNGTSTFDIYNFFLIAFVSLLFCFFFFSCDSA